MRTVSFLLLVVAAFAATPMEARADGDAKRGGAQYRACVACHSLDAGAHLTGPSLADLWAKKAGGAKTIVERGLVSAGYVGYVRGQQPDSLKSAPPHARVSRVRHCRDSYFATAANGAETPYWEMNVRIQLDTRGTGPEPGKPVIVGAGMQVDRASLVFVGLEDVARVIAEAC